MRTVKKRNIQIFSPCEALNLDSKAVESLFHFFGRNSSLSNPIWRTFSGVPSREGSLQTPWGLSRWSHSDRCHHVPRRSRRKPGWRDVCIHRYGQTLRLNWSSWFFTRTDIISGPWLASSGRIWRPERKRSPSYEKRRASMYVPFGSARPRPLL